MYIYCKGKTKHSPLPEGKTTFVNLKGRCFMNKKLIVKALAALAFNPGLLDGISLPNINFPTMGGIFFWNDLANVNGWRMQQNTITQHVRILDPEDVRRAWGGIDAMERLIYRLANAD